MKAITINQLLAECQKQVENGNGDKHILISQDDEGNGYHECFFGFTPASEFGGADIDDYLLPYGVDGETFNNEYIVLG